MIDHDAVRLDSLLSEFAAQRPELAAEYDDSRREEWR